ncbi:hypothetical protein ACFLSJ_06295 [Verrucomicrobiota bacterium]
MMIHVFILTFCRNMEQFYGSELVFKTLRVGFPNARIAVADNASIPEARAEIEALAGKTGCSFEKIQRPGVQHHEFIQSKLNTFADGHAAGESVVFLDPDIAFWHACEGFEFDGLAASNEIVLHSPSESCHLKCRSLRELDDDHYSVGQPVDPIAPIQGFVLRYVCVLARDYHLLHAGVVSVGGGGHCLPRRFGYGKDHFDCEAGRAWLQVSLRRGRVLETRQG